MVSEAEQGIHFEIQDSCLEHLQALHKAGLASVVEQGRDATAEGVDHF